MSPSDTLATCLFQITGPAHIPYHDARWQQLLLHYEQLVHLHNLGLESSSASNGDRDAATAAAVDATNITSPFQLDGIDVVGNACRQCAKYSSTSSNLAALSLHVARMIRDLQSTLIELGEFYSRESQKEVDIDETNEAGANDAQRPDTGNGYWEKRFFFCITPGQA